MLMEMEEKVPLIMCNLEKTFPPLFLGSMKYLIVYLLFEARIGSQSNIDGYILLRGVAMLYLCLIIMRLNNI